MNTSCFSELITKRRSIYNLDKLPADDFEKITPIITDCLRQCPSAFNAQPGRIVLLYNENSGQLWDIVRQAVKPLTPPERWTQTSAKIDSFAAGSGTVLFLIPPCKTLMHYNYGQINHPAGIAPGTNARYLGGS